MSNQLPGGLKIVNQYLHAGNSSRKKRRGSKYVTLSKIIDRKGNVIAEGRSTCRKGDELSKFIGKNFADHRALLALFELQQA